MGCRACYGRLSLEWGFSVKLQALGQGRCAPRLDGVFQKLLAYVQISFCLFLSSSWPSGLSIPNQFLWLLHPDCFLLFSQRRGTGTYLNMSWSEFFQKTGIR